MHKARSEANYNDLTKSLTIKQQQPEVSKRATTADMTSGRTGSRQYATICAPKAQASWQFEFNLKAINKPFDEATQLTDAEKESFKNRVNRRMTQLESQQHKRFDSHRNKSIMLRPETNHLRNEVMRRIKSKQVKRNMLHSVQFKVQRELMKERGPDGV